MDNPIDRIIEAFQADPRGYAEAIAKLNGLDTKETNRLRKDVELSILFGEVKSKENEA